MKHTLLTLIAALGLVTSAGAQNLLTNGDFESGALSPWVGGSIAPDPSGGFFATTTAPISQTVPTVAV